MAWDQWGRGAMAAFEAVTRQAAEAAPAEDPVWPGVDPGPQAAAWGEPQGGGPQGAAWGEPQGSGGWGEPAGGEDAALSTDDIFGRLDFGADDLEDAPPAEVPPPAAPAAPVVIPPAAAAAPVVIPPCRPAAARPAAALGAWGVAQRAPPPAALPAAPAADGWALGAREAHSSRPQAQPPSARAVRPPAAPPAGRPAAMPAASTAPGAAAASADWWGPEPGASRAIASAASADWWGTEPGESTAPAAATTSADWGEPEPGESTAPALAATSADWWEPEPGASTAPALAATSADWWEPEPDSEVMRVPLAAFDKINPRREFLRKHTGGADIVCLKMDGHLRVTITGEPDQRKAGRAAVDALVSRLDAAEASQAPAVSSGSKAAAAPPAPLAGPAQRPGASSFPAVRARPVAKAGAAAAPPPAGPAGVPAVPARRPLAPLARAPPGVARPAKDEGGGEEPAQSQVLEFPAHLLGRFIGKGGQKIKSLQEDTGASIKVAEKDPETCQVTIDGAPDSLQKAVAAVNEIADTFSGSEPLVLRYDVKIGLIIGKGGSQIKEVRSQCGVNIEVKEVDGQAQVSITGAPKKVQSAKEMIDRIVSGQQEAADTGSGASGASDKAADADEEFMELPDRDAVRKVIGKSGDTIKRIQTESHAKVAVLNAEHASTEPPVVHFAGTFEAVDRARGMVFDVLQELEKGGKADWPEWTDEDFLMVPQASCKSLVGADGANIQQIENDSWATVEIDSAWRDTGKRAVMLEISGGLEAVDKARELVRELLARVPKPGPKRQPWKKQESWGAEAEWASDSNKRKWTAGADWRESKAGSGAKR